MVTERKILSRPTLEIIHDLDVTFNFSSSILTAIFYAWPAAMP
jgi:hypothetical protein